MSTNQKNNAETKTTQSSAVNAFVSLPCDKDDRKVLPGLCCCNCKWQMKLMCHPWNENFCKGQISEQCGWICTVQYPDGSNKKEATFMDSQHGVCELHEERSN